MRILIQRVSYARVVIQGMEKSSIGEGLLVLIGVEEADDEKDVEYLSGKLVNLRIFEDENKKMNLSLKEKNAELMLVSQFTLYASTQKGNRPSFIKAARPEKAESLYKSFVTNCEKLLERMVATGEFGANMQIELLNSGPVTLFMDSRNKE